MKTLQEVLRLPLNSWLRVEQSSGAVLLEKEGDWEATSWRVNPVTSMLEEHLGLGEYASTEWLYDPKSDQVTALVRAASKSETTPQRGKLFFSGSDYTSHRSMKIACMIGACLMLAWWAYSVFRSWMQWRDVGEMIGLQRPSIAKMLWYNIENLLGCILLIGPSLWMFRLRNPQRALIAFAITAAGLLGGFYLWDRLRWLGTTPLLFNLPALAAALWAMARQNRTNAVLAVGWAMLIVALLGFTGLGMGYRRSQLILRWPFWLTLAAVLPAVWALWKHSRLQAALLLLCCSSICRFCWWQELIAAFAGKPQQAAEQADGAGWSQPERRAKTITPAVSPAPAIGNFTAPAPPDSKHSPSKAFSIEWMEGAPLNAAPPDDHTLVLWRGSREVVRYPALGLLLDAHWSQDERYVAINNRRGNSGDYLWVIRTSDGAALKKPDDALGREIEERALAQADEAAKRMSPAFQRRKSWITALGWTQDVKLRASVHAGYIIPNSDGWAQDIPVLLSLAGNTISVESIGNAPDGYVQPQQSSRDFSRWLQENWNIVLDCERREFIIEFDWGARFGAMRWSAPISAFALSETSVGATNERGAFRDNTRVRIPLRPGYSAVMRKWDPSVTVNMAEAPWLTSLPPNSDEKESQAVEVYAKGPGEAVELVAALKRISEELVESGDSPTQAAGQSPAAGPQSEASKASPEKSIEAFIRAHHEKASRRDVTGFSSDYADSFWLKDKQTSRFAIQAETQAYHDDHPQVAETIVSPVTIIGATTSGPRARYRMDSSTVNLQTKASHNVILLELHLRSKGDGAWEIVQENELERVKQTPPASVPTQPARPANPAAKPPSKSSSPLRERVRSLEDL